MKSQFYHSVDSLLTRKYFEHSKVIAGKKGLNRQVKWVHVVEVTSIKNLLNGNELILTTGLALKEETTFLSLIHQLIEIHAAALCIELETNLSSIPSSVKELADRNDFPIIVFEKEVPFVSITQDIHSILINQQYEIMKKLDDFAQVLNKRLLSVNHSQEILSVLHKELGVPVILQMKEQEPQLYPFMKREEEMTVRKRFDEHLKHPRNDFTSAKVILFDQEYAELFIYREDHPFSEYDVLLLDRTSTALAQFLMRELYFNEKKRMEESKWIMSWLKGEQSHETLEAYLRNLKMEIHGGVVCVFDEIGEQKDLTYFNLVARSIFLQQGFHALTEREGDDLLFILLDTRKQADWKKRAKIALEKISQSRYLENGPNNVISIGNYQEEMMNIHVSYKTARESKMFSSKVSLEHPFIFFDDLHLYRLISVVNNNVNLWGMIEEYLKPLILHDKEHDGSLLLTLKTFLSCQGSKQETAKKLFIVRQTLYHRLKKIEDLLGEDYMSSEKRLAIEFLLAAHDYLEPTKKVKRLSAIK
ncbi:PucR family transcriptional regulator [Rossellomorea aquimaris]|uniref:PucR family transcriptional regulator n=1 Tax=Rossellomorea aquimaris TaxID=189382 RepID=UPI001CD59F38|nr:PucR family transcriptional regulator [Rossellomorea aquimaris]MCA1053606.1 PucR family transcriptional regulator [Rossellomorea aquimaris]